MSDSKDEVTNFSEYMKLQKKEMESYKWIESEKCGYDLGDEALLEWIQKYAISYRNWYRNRKK